MKKLKQEDLQIFILIIKKIKIHKIFHGKQINPNFEFGGIIIATDIEGLTTVEIRNKLSKGDMLEVMVPNILKPYTFKIEKLFDAETNEEIDEVNPGVKEQKVKIKFPIDVQNGYIIRRVK